MFAELRFYKTKKLKTKIKNSVFHLNQIFFLEVGYLQYSHVGITVASTLSK